MKIFLQRSISLLVFFMVISCGEETEQGSQIPQSIAVTPTAVTLKVEGTTSLSVLGTYSDGTSADVTSQVTLTTESAGKTSTVANGIVTGVAAGSDKVIATLQTLTASATITVESLAASSSSTTTSSAGAGTSAAGSGSTSTPGAETPPDPINPVASVTSATQITLSWSSGGGSTASYQVAYLLGAIAPSNCSSGSASAVESYAVTGLSPGTQYSFRICALESTATASSVGVTVTATTASYHQIFVTAGAWDGAEVGGLTGADDKCQADAVANGLAGTWKAVLSDGTTTAAARIAINGLVKNMRPAGSGGPQTVANDEAGFFGGTIFASVNYGASGAGAGVGYVWTGTLVGGGTSANHCTGWTATAGSGGRGDRNTQSPATIQAATALCTTNLKLYCIDGQ